MKKKTPKMVIIGLILVAIPALTAFIYGLVTAFQIQLGFGIFASLFVMFLMVATLLTIAEKIN